MIVIPAKINSNSNKCIVLIGIVYIISIQLIKSMVVA